MNNIKEEVNTTENIETIDRPLFVKPIRTKKLRKHKKIKDMMDNIEGAVNDITQTE